MKSWRIFTWVILLVQGLFLYWMLVAIGSSADKCGGQSDELAEVCRSMSGIGVGLVAILVLLVWVLVDVILGVIWVVTNNNWNTPKPRKSAPPQVATKRCPDCAEDIHAHARVCRYCAHRFDTSRLKCFKCGYVNEVPESQFHFVCGQCGDNLKRRTQPSEKS